MCFFFSWSPHPISVSILYICYFGQCSVAAIRLVPRDEWLFSLGERAYRLWGPPSLLLNEYRDSLLRVKQLGRVVNHSLPATAEVKNKWGYISLLTLHAFMVWPEKILSLHLSEVKGSEVKGSEGKWSEGKGSEGKESEVKGREVK